jgi:hypothetical protein
VLNVSFIGCGKTQAIGIVPAQILDIAISIESTALHLRCSVDYHCIFFVVTIIHRATLIIQHNTSIILPGLCFR